MQMHPAAQRVRVDHQTPKSQAGSRFGTGTSTSMSSEGGTEWHSCALQGLCRVCGRLLTTQKVTYPCKDHTETLKHTFSIEVGSDNPNIHPPKLCSNCSHSTLTHEKQACGGKEYKHAIDVVKWKEHSYDGNCQTCERYTKSRQGGRPRKSRKNRGRPTADASRRAEFNKYIQSVAAPKAGADVPLAPSRFVSVVGVKGLVCMICRNVVDQGLEKRCNHVVCAPCLCARLDATSIGILSCPACSTQLTSNSDVHPMSPVVQCGLRSLRSLTHMGVMR